MSDPTVKYVAQREQDDCFCACLAMLAGWDYEGAISVLPVNQWDKPMETGRAAYFLGRAGLATRIVITTDPAHMQPTGLRLMCAQGHYVVILPNGMVHDPGRGPNQPPDLPAYREPFQVWEIHRVDPAAEPEDHARGCECERCHENFLDAQAESLVR